MPNLTGTMGAESKPGKPGEGMRDFARKLKNSALIQRPTATQCPSTAAVLQLVDSSIVGV
jgi:hypothetical protein